MAEVVHPLVGAGVSAPRGQESPVTWAGVSGVKLAAMTLQPASAAQPDLFSLSSIVASSKLLDLPIPPPKLVDLWRIEGEDLDLSFHPISFGFPLDL